MPKLALMFFSRSKGSDRNPASQLGGKLPRVLHVRFRHQDHEFVSAIARHHVGAPAIRLQDVSHPLQHQVAFQMPIEIVHEFEAVQVHQHQREGPRPRASNASTPPKALP